MPYEQIPLISQKQFEKLLQASELVLHYNLIVDYAGFNHPGYLETINRFRANKSLKPIFKKNIPLMLTSLFAIKPQGDSKTPTKKLKAIAFMGKKKDSQINQNHEKLMSKFDFSKPIIENINKSNMGQLFLLTQIPNFFKNLFQVAVAKKQSFWDEFFAKQHKWSCSGVFLIDIIIIIAFIAFIAYNYTFMDFLLKIHFIIFGFVASFYFLVATLEIALMLMGICFGLILYDFINYNSHYGPELNIGWLKAFGTHHLKHHFKDQHNLYGITCAIQYHFYKTMKPK